MAINMEIKLTMFTSERYEQNISSTLADRLGDYTGPQPGLPKTKAVYLAR
jgi:hypothetical protein